MKNFRHLLFLCALLFAVASCKKDKDKDPAPSKTDLITAKTWKDQSESLRLNTSEGTRTIAATDAESYQFGRDGKVTTTSASGTTSSGTWAFANNETQFTITNGTNTTTFDIFDLSATSFSYGYSYNQSQIQQALGGGGGTSGQFLVLLLLSAGNYTFASGTPNIPAAQLTSVQWKANTVPK